MKTRLLLTAITAMLILFVTLPNLAQQERFADGQEITKLMTEINRAYIARNFEPFERIYLENFISIKSRPSYNLRSQLIAMMKWDAAAKTVRKPIDFQTLSYDFDPPRITFFGDAAVVNVAKRHHWSYRSEKCLSRYQVTEVWVKRAVGWRLRAGHTSTTQCERVPVNPGHPALAGIPSQIRPPRSLDIVAEQEARRLIDHATTAVTDNISTINSYVANGFVSTEVTGSVGENSASMAEALRHRQRGSTLPSRNDELLHADGNTAIFSFRFPVKSRTGATVAEELVQGTAVLVKTDGSWRFAAWHASRVSVE